MDICLVMSSVSSYGFRSDSINRTAFRPSYFAKGSPGKPQQNGDNDNTRKRGEGDKFSTDWDKAWSSFKRQGKKTLFSGFTPDKYVTWNPRRSEFPLTEEVDPIKRTERSNLRLWTSPGFTLGLAVVIVTFLLVYTILYPIK